MFRLLTYSLTTSSMLVHAAIGCCWHHHHAKASVVDAETSREQTAESASSGHFRCGHCCCRDRATHKQSEKSAETSVVRLSLQVRSCPGSGHPQDGVPCETCSEGRCTYVRTSEPKMPRTLHLKTFQGMSENAHSAVSRHVLGTQLLPGFQFEPCPPLPSRSRIQVWLI